MEQTRHLPAEVLPTHTRQLFQTAVLRAAELLSAGEVIALPTETVYGLVANALDARAVERIFEIKGRPVHNPIIVHVSDVKMARACAAAWPPLAAKLAKAFWPGPLTLVLPRASQIPPMVTAGGPTVGIRWPSHPFIQAVIRQCGFPLAAPSANLSNQISPTNVEHVLKSLGDKIRLIVDGGQPQVGIESTVLDLSVSPPRLLRPGMIHDQSLLAVTGQLALCSGDSDEVLKSPGQLKRHYAPKARLVIMSWRDDKDLRYQLAHLSLPVSLSSSEEGRVGERRSLSRPPSPAPRPSACRAEVQNEGGPLPSCHIIAHTQIPSGTGFGRVSVIPHDPEAFARAIYAELHQCDEAGAGLIVVGALPETIEWRAIADRLNRAAAT